MQEVRVQHPQLQPPIRPPASGDFGDGAEAAQPGVEGRDRCVALAGGLAKAGQELALLLDEIGFGHEEGRLLGPDKRNGWTLVRPRLYPGWPLTR